MFCHVLVPPLVRRAYTPSPILRQNIALLEEGNLNQENYKKRSEILHLIGSQFKEGRPSVDENLDLALKRFSPSALSFSESDTTTPQNVNTIEQSLLSSTIDNDGEPYCGLDWDNDGHVSSLEKGNSAVANSMKGVLIEFADFKKTQSQCQKAIAAHENIRESHCKEIGCLNISCQRSDKK